jgi:hypothetical protein
MILEWTIAHTSVQSIVDACNKVDAYHDKGNTYYQIAITQQQSQVQERTSSSSNKPNSFLLFAIIIRTTCILLRPILTTQSSTPVTTTCRFATSNRRKSSCAAFFVHVSLLEHYSSTRIWKSHLGVQFNDPGGTDESNG